TPQKAAGTRTEPPRSEPWAMGPMPVATATAAPPLEPPQVSSGFHGFRVAPKTALNVFPPAPNSGVFVLPTTMAPAALRRWTTSPSASGRWSWKMRAATVLRIPLVANRSLIDTGTPWSEGNLADLRLSRRVARRAAANADSRATVT